MDERPRMAHRARYIVQHVDYSWDGIGWVCHSIDNRSELAIWPLPPLSPLLFAHLSEDSAETSCQLELQSVAIGNTVGFITLRTFGEHSRKIVGAPCGSLIGEPRKIHSAANIVGHLTIEATIEIYEHEILVAFYELQFE